MSHRLMKSASLLRWLFQIDQTLMQELRSTRCVDCGGPLHQAHYYRDPRGGPEIPKDEDDDFATKRFSLCCGWEGCRSRATPQSVRFLGRRWYLATVVVLVGCMMSPRAARVRRVQSMFGMDRRTIERWRRWWREALPSSPFWRGVRGRLSPRIDEDHLPRSLLRRFGSERGDALVKLLRFLQPISSATAPGAQVF